LNFALDIYKYKGYQSMSDQYSINPASRGANNFFEGLTNSSNPTYIQPIAPVYTPAPAPVYAAPKPLKLQPFIPCPVYKLSTTMYNPECLGKEFDRFR
jgi:hypothetical protein